MRVPRFLLVASIALSFCVGSTGYADVEDLGEPDEVYNELGALGTWQRDGLDQADASFTAVVDFDAKSDGEREVIWESGGGTVGASLVYEAPGALVLRQAGSGGNIVATIVYVLPQGLVDGGDVNLAWGFQVDNGEGLQSLALVVNGATVNSLTMAIEADWSGSNAAAYGVKTSDLAAGGGNTALPGIDFASGTINVVEGLKFYTGVYYCPATTDADGDGLADELEALYGVDLTADGDADEDGLSDGQELALGLHPTNADTNGDGVADADEDSDGDGLTNGEELAGDPATDPGNPDTDGDGFRDDVEVAAGADPTDPQSVPEPDCNGVTELGEPTLVNNTIGTFASLNGNNDTADATFTVVVDFEEKTGGPREVIFETGAGTIGTSLVYEAPNTLVYRSDGNGGFSLLTLEYLLPANVIAGGDVSVAFTYDVDSVPGLETLRLYINGYKVTSATMDLGGDFSGGDGASFGAASGNLAGTGSNSGLTGVDFASGVINVDEGFKFYAQTLLCPETTDGDGDGLADEWEALYSADLATLGADGDADGDTLTDAGELDLGTDPTSADTDGDGLDDGAELEAGTNPFRSDSDGDGLSDGEEATAGTDPLNTDSDGDGISDGAEVRKGSDPANPDDVPPNCLVDLPPEPTEVLNETGPTGTWERSGFDQMDATFTAVIDFEPKTEGDREVIWESGGATVGASIVYEVPSTVVLRQVGNAGIDIATVRYALPSSLLDAGDVELAWSTDVDNGEDLQTINLIVGGTIVGSVTADLEPDWTGNNGGGFGALTDALTAAGNNTTLTGIEFISGVINTDAGLVFYADWFYCPESADSDEDGLPDGWEEIYAPGDLTVLSGDGDADSDGLSDGDELAFGTDPTNPDTDGDGILDGAEIDGGFDPFAREILQVAGDCNGDGLVDVSDILCTVAISYPQFDLLSRDPVTLPCEGDPSSAGNVALLDVNGDGSVDFNDGVYLSMLLFAGGPPPVQGGGCTAIPAGVGCEASASCGG